MTEGIANAIMYWLGFGEYTPLDMILERGLGGEGVEEDIDMELGPDYDE